MIVLAPAKINLGLEVLRKRPDGYHDIRTLYQWIDFFDVIEFRPPTGSRIRLSGDDRSIPWDESNLVYRAAESLRRKSGRDDGVDIIVTKKIPAGGGFGGGSSDAAAVLLGLDRFWGLGLERSVLHALARELGMDVPYFLVGGLCLGEDCGDRLTPLPDFSRKWVVCVLPPFGISTRRIYGSLAESALTSEDKVSKIMRFLETRESGSLANALEETIFRFVPQLREIKGFLRDQGAVLSLVTGSGSGVFGLFENREGAERCRAALEGRYAAVVAATMSREEGWKAITAGASPSGKAAGFGPAIRGFESSRPR